MSTWNMNICSHGAKELQRLPLFHLSNTSRDPLSKSARRSSAHFTNRTKITVFMCKQKLYPIWFSWRCNSYPVNLQSGALSSGIAKFTIRYSVDTAKTSFPDSTAIGEYKGSRAVCSTFPWTRVTKPLETSVYLTVSNSLMSNSHVGSSSVNSGV